MAKARDDSIAIVGGGIAGLYCAYVLGTQGHKVTLYERTARLGGRIRTIRLDRDANELDHANWTRDNLEFYAEFGPMRIELDMQPLVRALLTKLDIVKRHSANEQQLPGAHLVEFPAYTSPGSAREPEYGLLPDESDYTPLQLLQLALLRIACDVRTQASSSSSFMKLRKKLIDSLGIAGATGASWEPVFSQWVKDLREQDYWEIQTKGFVTRRYPPDRAEQRVPLYRIGFWNLLDDYLSHNAITKIRELGSFYHLLPENPNAGEWFVWWLRGFAISETLHGVYGGMECVIDNLTSRMPSSVSIRYRHSLKQITHTNAKTLQLRFQVTETTDRGRASAREIKVSHRRVVLSLPKQPLVRVVGASKDVFENVMGEGDIEGLLDSAFAFPMMKTFVVVRRRWWEEENRANRFANDIPTRELHYWKGKTSGSRQGMIMAYTDRPASAFWANYVPPGAQEDIFGKGFWPAGGGARPTVNLNKQQLTELEHRLKEKVCRYITRTDISGFHRDDIAWYGIRDWSREPYGGANHAWRPERKYWVIMRRLGDVGRPSMPSGTERQTPNRIMICGEAFSDYHGFIEGALRSAVYVLHRLLDRPRGSSLAWLPTLFDTVEKETMQSLRSWVKELDGCPINSSYF